MLGFSGLNPSMFPSRFVKFGFETALVRCRDSLKLSNSTFNSLFSAVRLATAD